MTVVAAKISNPSAFMFKPFSSPRWAKDEGNFPVVNVEKPAGLVGLAKFLADNIPATHRRRATIVACYAAEGSERALIRKNYGDRMGSNGQLYAENIIKCYGISETERAVINDWDFGLIDDNQTPESYWNEQADRMVGAGVEIVKIRSSVGSPAVEFKCGKYADH